MIELDHISYGTRNLYAGAHRLREETGLDSFEGCWSDASGTANRYVPLPDGVFIQIDSLIDAGSGLLGTEWFLDATANGDAWMFWALRATTMDELEAIAERVGSTVVVVEEGLITADGRSLGWTMTPPPPGPWMHGLPNWYYWEDESIHPSRGTADHRRPFTGVAWMEVGGEAAVMEAHIGSEAFESLPLRFVDQPPGLYAVAVATEDGDDVVIRRPSAVAAFSRLAEMEFSEEMLGHADS